jgi:hypothetical protein
VRALEVEERTLDESTRSAAEAAAAIGCEEGQIVKSLVFMTDDGPLVCLCAGDRRVDPARLPPGARTASPDEVREATGFAIGGVPPLGHERELVNDRRRLIAPLRARVGGRGHAAVRVRGRHRGADRGARGGRGLRPCRVTNLEGASP